ncbi:MAG: hypothetical protein SV910_03975 [Chloroflexota bacterium]|nr:hypothetical protein [Chloroflexota bacterium]
MFWDDEYRKGERIWGVAPSELGVVAGDYVQGHGAMAGRVRILDRQPAEDEGR